MERFFFDDFRIVEGKMWWSLAGLHAENRGVQIPDEPPPRCVAVLTRRGSWVGSVGVIEHGPLLMFEWLVLDNRQPATWRHAGLWRLMLHGKAYAAAVGKRPVMVVDRRRGGVGIRKMAERLGFASRNEYLEVLEGK